MFLAPLSNDRQAKNEINDFAIGIVGKQGEPENPAFLVEKISFTENMEEVQQNVSDIQKRREKRPISGRTIYKFAPRHLKIYVPKFRFPEEFFSSNYGHW